jgi:hypothetical protein
MGSKDFMGKWVYAQKGSVAAANKGEYSGIRTWGKFTNI